MIELEIEFKEKTKMSFQEFHEKYSTKLVWFLMKMCKDESTAKDVADDALIKCLTEIHKYHPEKANISTWTFAIARYAMLQKLDKARKFESIEEDHDGATIADFLQTNINEDAEEKEHLLQKKINLLNTVIMELPDKYAKILTMRHLDCLSYAEISKVSNLKLNTVKSRIKGGRALLEKRLRHKWEEIDEMGV